MASIENGRRSRSKELLEFLYSTGYPWNDFNPSFSGDTKKLVGQLLKHFRKASVEVNNFINVDYKVNKKGIKLKDRGKSKYGKFIDYLEVIIKDPTFREEQPILVNQLEEAFKNDDIYTLHKILNRHYRELIPYWELCQTSGNPNCQPAKDLEDLYNLFASPDIQEDVENKLTRRQDITGILFEKPFSMSIYYEPLRGIRRGRRESLLFRLGLMMSLVPEKDIGELVKVNVWLTDREKMFSLPYDDYIGIMNVNSGCTIRDFQSNPVGRVIIWREEECDKVLVHELIHALGLDFFNYDKSIDGEVYQMFDIDKKDNINIFETYTETWTVILSSTIYSLQCGKGTVNEVMNLLRLESAYSLLQVAKILVYYGYSKFSDCGFFCPSGHQSDIRKGKFRQGSSILAYYVLKAALLHKLDSFINYCGIDRERPWLFNGDEKGLWVVIKKAVSDHKFIGLVNMLMTNYKGADNFVHHSLRMTLNEFRPV